MLEDFFKVMPNHMKVLPGHYKGLRAHQRDMPPCWFLVAIIRICKQAMGHLNINVSWIKISLIGDSWLSTLNSVSHSIRILPIPALAQQLFMMILIYYVETAEQVWPSGNLLEQVPNFARNFICFNDYIGRCVAATNEVMFTVGSLK